MLGDTNNENTIIERNEEKIAKLTWKQKTVVDLLQKSREHILRILAQQTELLTFLIHLPGEIEVRVVHNMAQVTAPQGLPRMDKKVA